MHELLKSLPDWSRYIFLAALAVLIGASGKDVLQMFVKEPESTKVPIMVRSEKTKKALENVEISVITNAAPLSLKTDSRGYAEFQISKLSSIRIELTKLGYLENQTTLNLNEGEVPTPTARRYGLGFQFHRL